MGQLNASIHYQIFCGIRISSANPLTNYKLIDDIILELSNRLRIQNQQEALAEAWKPYMKNLDTLYTDATCYESAMRYPTDGAASAEPNLFELCRVVTEEGGCQAAVGMYRKGISDDVRGKPYVRPIVRGKENREGRI